MLSEEKSIALHQTTAPPWLSIIGIGADGISGLSAAARDLIASADLVVGGARHLALASGLFQGRTLPWPSPIHDAIPDILAMRGKPTVVLASGDPFFFGVGSMLSPHVSPTEFVCLAAPSSIALAAARLGWAQQDVDVVSLHGRELETVIPHLQPGARILALSWDSTTPSRLAELLCARGMAESTIHVLENLGAAAEQVRSTTAATFSLDEIDDLNIIALEVVAGAEARIVPIGYGLPDGFFEHDGQLTKQDVRAITMAALAPRPGETLWDIGLGAGSVAIEWLLAHPSCNATGIEAREDRAQRAASNARELGVPRLEVIVGSAPDALADLPQPHAVFIGGGATEPGLFEAVWDALPSGGRIVVNAVTLETEALLLTCQASRGGDLVRIGLARAEPVGSRQGWRAAMPVTQWRVTKP
jgi:precorrin-6B C5,15-methyltransferase / cobalt-precorrin-6B C5,C15-methyltransferase